MKTTIRKDLVEILTHYNIPLRQIQAATYEKLCLSGKPIEFINLYPGHTDSEFDRWLSKMESIESGSTRSDFESTIWLKGNIWITREQCKDGMYGWWVIHKRPPLPKKSYDAASRQAELDKENEQAIRNAEDPNYPTRDE